MSQPWNATSLAAALNATGNYQAEVNGSLVAIVDNDTPEFPIVAFVGEKQMTFQTTLSSVSEVDESRLNADLMRNMDDFPLSNVQITKRGEREVYVMNGAMSPNSIEESVVYELVMLTQNAVLGLEGIVGHYLLATEGAE